MFVQGGGLNTILESGIFPLAIHFTKGYNSHMAKTVHIPREIHQACRIGAALAGVSLADFVAELLRLGLSQARKPRTPAAVTPTAAAGSQSEAPDAVTPEATKADAQPDGEATERDGGVIARPAVPVQT